MVYYKTMDKWVMCIVALVLGMLMFHMLKNVCGCKVVEGQCVNDTTEVTDDTYSGYVCEEGAADECTGARPLWMPGDTNSVLTGNPLTCDNFCKSAPKLLGECGGGGDRSNCKCTTGSY